MVLWLDRPIRCILYHWIHTYISNICIGIYVPTVRTAGLALNAEAHTTHTRCIKWPARLSVWNKSTFVHPKWIIYIVQNRNKIKLLFFFRFSSGRPIWSASASESESPSEDALRMLRLVRGRHRRVHLQKAMQEYIPKTEIGRDKKKKKTHETMRVAAASSQPGRPVSESEENAGNWRRRGMGGGDEKTNKRNENNLIKTSKCCSSILFFSSTSSSCFVLALRFCFALRFGPYWTRTDHHVDMDDWNDGERNGTSVYRRGHGVCRRWHNSSARQTEFLVAASMQWSDRSPAYGMHTGKVGTMSGTVISRSLSLFAL